MNSNLERPSKMSQFLDQVGNKLVGPLFKIKGLSESSSPYPLVLLSIILLSISLSAYLLLFREQSFLNFGFMQLFTGLILSYVLCRKLNLRPYLTQQKSQKELKISTFLLLIGMLSLI